MIRTETRPASAAARRVILLAALGIAIVATLWIGQYQPAPYGSPDEAANAFFIKQFGLNHRLRVPSPLTAAELNFAHPRSMVAIGQELRPASFLGLVQIGGLIDRWFGEGASRWLTPVLSIFGLLAFYGLLRRFWSESWSLLGTLLLALHPVWFQYQTLPMFHNGAFVSLLIVAGYSLRRQFERPTWIWAIAVGLAYGAAIYFRPIEVLWTGPLLAIVLLTMPGRWKWFCIALIGALLVQIPWLYADHQIYGAVLSTGYTPEGLSSNGGGVAAISSLWKVITPAGGHWSLHFISSAWWYLVLLFPASSVLVITAVGQYVKRKFIVWSKIVKLSLVGIFILFPLAYYGSWDLYPLLSASRVGTLASYDRYWLVIFVAMVPAMVLTLKRIWAVRPFISAAVVIMVLAGYIATIGWHPGSGLFVRYDRQNEAIQMHRSVLALTDAKSLIIAGDNDKYFFGERLTGNAMPTNVDQWNTLGKMVVERSIYILKSTPNFSAAAVRDHLAPFGYSATRVAVVPGDELWQITVRTQ